MSYRQEFNGPDSPEVFIIEGKIMNTEQKYIYLGPGEIKPCVVPEEVEFWRECDCEWVTRSKDMVSIGRLNHYRFAVTDAEYRAHHGMIAWPCACPEGYEVVDFRCGEIGETALSYNNVYFTIYEDERHYTFPILRKIELKIKWVVPTDEDAPHRPKVACDGKIYTLVAVDTEPTTDLKFFVKDKAGNVYSKFSCKMDARLREGWQ